ncbi:MAG: PLP-dependent aminotransferase family protein, partial [Edaphobacter sp.]
MSTLLNIASLKAEGAAPRYEQIANAVCQAIRSGQLKPGDRLPTVRALATGLGVSLTTVTTAFKSLTESGWTRGEIGRGTFVEERGGYEILASSVSMPAARVSPRINSPWRKRALVSSMERLRSSFPTAANCSFGGPDPSLLPLKIIRRHWLAVFNDVTNRDLQYKTVSPLESLAEVLSARLVADGIPVTSRDILVGSSAQQFMVLATDVISRLGGSPEPVVAVEQPGYYTIFDAWDHAGVQMMGIETDGNGARPESVESAILSGANAVLLTPRAHNPTGACWTPARLQALGDVLSRHPHVFAIEDDHFGDIANDRSGSLLADARIEDRVIYIRSFSKSIAPDLRLSVAAARAPLKTLLEGAR